MELIAIIISLLNLIVSISRMHYASKQKIIQPIIIRINKNHKEEK